MIRHEGFLQFSLGAFDNGGDNLFVDANGTIRRIMDNDLNGDGIFDLVLPNSHGYVERAPTEIHKEKDDGRWELIRLPQDSGWMPRVVDLDGDGYPDLVVANGENGVSSELQSYIHWGGPHGLSGECSYFDTIGAYDVAFWDLTGNGLKDIVFTTAWCDHHNPGKPLWQKIFVQTAPRQFTDATAVFKISGVATTSLLCEDLSGNGSPDLVLANRRLHHDSRTDSFVYHGSNAGFDGATPVGLPTVGCTQVLAYDLRGDGFKDLVFTCRDHLMIYRSDRGRFDPLRCEIIEVPGSYTQFAKGVLGTDIADIDGDGIPELLIGMADGIEIRKANCLDRIHAKIECYACSSLRASDIKNTGTMDLIVPQYCSQKTYDTESLIFWNTGSGYDVNHTTALPTHGPMGCTAADLDNDGIKEIIFCNTMSGPSQYDPEFPVFVYFGNQNLQYKAENRRDYPINKMSHCYAVADVDNDGFVELIVTAAHGVRIFKGTDRGPDPAIYTDIVHPLGDELLVGGVLVGDFNRDGWLDLIMVPWVKSTDDAVLKNSVFVYYGGPSGYSQQHRQCLPANIDTASGIVLADINNSGYADFLYGSRDGYLGVYYGAHDGFDVKRCGKIHLKEPNGAHILGLSAVDLDGDNELELCVTTAGHYTRQASHVYILKDAKNGYPPEKNLKFETGGSTGQPAFADLTGDGKLDLLLPFYSTTESRELPARIFKGNGKGNFDWINPISIDCLSSIAFLPVDLNGNGYKDLFICCHRNNLGHIVNSKLIRNGPGGLDIDNAEDILGYGPHNFTAKDQGNTRDRGDAEYYTSPVFACDAPHDLEWEGQTPYRTALEMRVRFGSTEQAVLAAAWSEPIRDRAFRITAPSDSRYMQYSAAFYAPGLVNSPTLMRVTIACGVKRPGSSGSIRTPGNA